MIFKAPFQYNVFRGYIESEIDLDPSNFLEYSDEGKLKDAVLDDIYDRMNLGDIEVDQSEMEFELPQEFVNEWKALVEDLTFTVGAHIVAEVKDYTEMELDPKDFLYCVDLEELKDEVMQTLLEGTQWGSCEEILDVYEDKSTIVIPDEFIEKWKNLKHLK